MRGCRRALHVASPLWLTFFSAFRLWAAFHLKEAARSPRVRLVAHAHPAVLGLLARVVVVALRHGVGKECTACRHYHVRHLAPRVHVRCAEHTCVKHCVVGEDSSCRESLLFETDRGAMRLFHRARGQPRGTRRKSATSLKTKHKASPYKRFAPSRTRHAASPPFPLSSGVHDPHPEAEPSRCLQLVLIRTNFLLDGVS